MKYIISFVIRYIPRKYLQYVGVAAVRILRLAYYGNKVECPICNSHYRKFLPYGRINPRQNALCPNCLSLERHRLIWLYLKQQTDFFSKPQKILHIAPEACFIERFEKTHRDLYITADLESPLAKVKMDIHHIPFPENTFDVVICNHVLEHVQDDIKAMSEICRVLKPSAWAILQVPFYPPLPEVTFEDFSIADPREREKIFHQRDHVRKFGKDYVNRIEKSGLKAKPETFAFNLPDSLCMRHAIVREEIYIGKKISRGM
jgi:SAM-dependent methyltransferase